MSSMQMLEGKVNVKGIPALITAGIAMYYHNNPVLFIIFILITMVLLHFAKTDLRQKDATNKIRKVVIDMGYSSDDVERLTMTTASVLQEDYVQRRRSNPKEYKPPQSAIGATYEVIDEVNSVARAASEWTTFTQSELVGAIQTAATLINVAPPQR